MKTTKHSNIIGATIVSVRPMVIKEINDEGWSETEIPSCIVLSSGTILYPSRDPEGNGAGALFGVDKEGSLFALYAEDTK